MRFFEFIQRKFSDLSTLHFLDLPVIFPPILIRQPLISHGFIYYSPIILLSIVELVHDLFLPG